MGVTRHDEVWSAVEGTVLRVALIYLGRGLEVIVGLLSASTRSKFPTNHIRHGESINFMSHQTMIINEPTSGCKRFLIFENSEISLSVVIKVYINNKSITYISSGKFTRTTERRSEIGVSSNLNLLPRRPAQCRQG